jgi:hypothetical protein
MATQPLRQNPPLNYITQPEWIALPFVTIKEKTNAKRPSPHSDSEIWEQAELLIIARFESFARNKVAQHYFEINIRNKYYCFKIKNIKTRRNIVRGIFHVICTIL